MRRGLEDQFAGLSDLRERVRYRENLTDNCNDRPLSDVQFYTGADAKRKLTLRPAKYNFAKFTPSRFCRYFCYDDARFVASCILKGDVRVVVLFCAYFNHVGCKSWMVY
jgi:hypothetical protein